MKSPEREVQVDAYKNPTKLFRLISESASHEKIIQHILTHPDEAKTWIVSYKHSKNDITWKYLPIHLVCMQSPSLPLLQTLTKVYPQSITTRDYFGNLALFYLLQQECQEFDVLQTVMVDDYSSLCQKNANGVSIVDLIQTYGNQDVKDTLTHWFQQLKLKQKQKRQKNSSEELYTIQELTQRIQQLEWECDAKDETIDELSAQLMSLVESRKRKNIKEKESNNNGDMMDIEKIKDLESKLELDAKIVAEQETNIQSLTTQLEEASKERTRQDEKNTRLEQQILALQQQLDQHDEAVAHVRKVSTILQTDLDDKTKELEQANQKLQDAEQVNANLKNQMEQQTRDAELRLEAFQTNVRNQSEALQSLLLTLKEKEKENAIKIDRDLKVLNDRIAQKDIELLALERQLSAALERNVLLTEQLAERDREMNVKLMDMKIWYVQQNLENTSKNHDNGDANGNVSTFLNFRPRPMQTKTVTREEPIQSKGNQISESSSSESSSSNSGSSSSNPASSSSSETHSSMVSTIEIREKQNQLQSELRDIYFQIQAAMQVRKSQSDGSMAKENSLKLNLKQLLEEKKNTRPWNEVGEAKEDDKVQNKSFAEMEQDEVYNAESWGVKSGEGSIYSM